MVTVAQTNYETGKPVKGIRSDGRDFSVSSLTMQNGIAPDGGIPVNFDMEFLKAGVAERNAGLTPRQDKLRALMLNQNFAAAGTGIDAPATALAAEPVQLGPDGLPLAKGNLAKPNKGPVIV